MMLRESKNPVVTFPIKKRINTELYIIIGKRGFIYKNGGRKLSSKMKRVKCIGRKTNVGMITEIGSLFGMT